MKPYIKPGINIVDLGCGGGIFSVVAARITDNESHIYAVDVQQEMLDITNALAKKRGMSHKISLHLCDAGSISLEDHIADFVLAIDMIHETGDPASTFAQISRITKSSGVLMAMEPKMHVDDELFAETVDLANKNGFVLEKPLSSIMGRGAIFRKDS